MLDARILYMKEENAHQHIFREPSNSGRLYSNARDMLINDISIEDKTWKREECSFLIKKETERTYEEPIDFSIDESDEYTYLEPNADGFEEVVKRVVKRTQEDECGSCGGDGVYCDRCDGDGIRSCSCVEGYNSSNCSNCGGSGKIEVLNPDLDKKNMQCVDCDGTGVKKTSHSRCNGTGSIQCKNCLGGNKDIECSDCKGSGEILKIEATRVEYYVRVNSDNHKPDGLSSADGYTIKNPKDSHWETTRSETFDSIEEAEEKGEKPSSSLLMPVPSGEKVKVKYTSEEIEYSKIDLVLDTSLLSDSEDNSTVEHTTWVSEDNSAYSGRIDAEKVSLSTSTASFAVKYVAFALFGGTIISLLLYLPFAIISDYIINIPDSRLAVVFLIILVVVNASLGWVSLIQSRYSFSV